MGETSPAAGVRFGGAAPRRGALPLSNEDIEQRVLAVLEERGITFERIECDPAFADTALFCARYGYPLEASANTIVVAARRDPTVACACVALATTRLDVNHRVRDLLRAGKLSFASPELTEQLTGMNLGGVTPFGLPEHLPLYVDSAVLAREWVIVGGGSRALKLRVPPSALMAVPGASAVDGLATPVPPSAGG